MIKKMMIVTVNEDDYTNKFVELSLVDKLIQSPDGTVWKLKVSNEGILSVEEV